MTRRDNEIPILTTPEHLELGIFAIEKVEKEIQVALPYMKAQLAKYNADLAEHYKGEIDELFGVDQIAVPTPPGNNPDMTVTMAAQSIMEKFREEAVAAEDEDEVLFDNLISDIANVIQNSKTEAWEGEVIEYVDGMKAAIKNAIKDHGAEITFHSAEKN